MIFAFEYARVSSIGQKDGDGYARQHDTVRKYADANGIIVEQTFKDAFTGSKDGLDRPGLNELFVAIKMNGVRLVIVENATRLARDLMVGEIILAEFRKLEAKVVSADGGVDLTVGNDDPTGKLVRQILSAVSEWEKCLLVQKMRVAKERIKKETGRCGGIYPFGHKPNETAPLVLMRNMRTLGATLQQITDKLNEQNVPTRIPGSTWHVGQVGRILARHATSSSD